MLHLYSSLGTAFDSGVQCTYIHVRTRTRTRTPTHAYTRKCTPTRTHTHAYMWMHTCLQMRHTHTCTRWVSPTFQRCLQRFPHLSFLFFLFFSSAAVSGSAACWSTCFCILSCLLLLLFLLKVVFISSKSIQLVFVCCSLGWQVHAVKDLQDLSI